MSRKKKKQTSPKRESQSETLTPNNTDTLRQENSVADKQTIGSGKGVSLQSIQRPAHVPRANVGAFFIALILFLLWFGYLSFVAWNG